MPYTINRYNGSQLSVIPDGTIDNTTDITIVGKNYAGYGTAQNENFLYLLENFANNTPPPRPISGQIWFDSSSSKLKFYDGNKFRTTGGAEIGGIQPTGLTTGDFWFDTTNKQLYAWDGSNFILIGPQAVPGSATTEMVSRSVRDTYGTSHTIIAAVTNGTTVFIISPDAEFALDPIVNPITGFTKVQQGVTLIDTNDDNQPGQTTTTHRFWGTATDSDRLGGYPLSDFVRNSNLQFTTLANFSDAGFTVGNTPKLHVFNDGATTPTIQNQFGDTIVFQTTVNSATVTPIKLIGSNIVPGVDATSNLGSNVLRFATINAVTFNGIATQANTVTLGTGTSSASIAATAGTIVARTTADQTINGVTITAGAVQGTYFVGTATSANYADLAEKYLADVEYDVGTVVMIGGEKEVTACQPGQRAIGAVSENPAYMMNAELEGGTFIALKGRVPVKVSGKVKKGNRLFAGNNGSAAVADPQSPDIFAIALEDNNDPTIKLVECLIL